MDSDRIKGKWKQIKGSMKEHWGKLTDDDLDQAEGHRDYLVGKVQERYGISKDEAREQVDDFERKL
ncbi:CsbD family protein [Guyparkeria sp. GHLCS8-2]|uniref:CsbD family protein n=1 Tax=Guyparkeria halopsychrophila TaxID=3139421 RepID=UPI0037C5098E